MELVIEVVLVDCRAVMLAASLSVAKREKARAERKKERRQCMMSMDGSAVLFDFKCSQRFNSKAFERDEPREHVCTLWGVRKKI